MMMDKLQFHDMTIYWLDGGNTAMDGGAMFGVVPKPLWSKKYPVNQNNQIELPTDRSKKSFINVSLSIGV